MSLRNFVALSAIAVSLAFLAGCSSSSSVTPPPTGGFTNANLNGAYVFSVAGTDVDGTPYAMVGSFTANGEGGNGTGGISAGSIDISCLDTTLFPNSVANLSLNTSSSSYTVGVDGRGKAHLVTSTATVAGTIVLDFVLQDSSHGLVTEFDEFGSGSGTLDVQTASVTPNGTYAFSFSGANASGAAFATVGEFTVSGGLISSGGFEDYNAGGIPYPDAASAALTLNGTVVAGPASSPATVLSTTDFPGLTFDVYPIDANHLKFIEIDSTGTLEGDAYSQTSTSMPVGALPFTLFGLSANGPIAAGGFMVTDSTNDVTNASTYDINNAGSGNFSSPASAFSGGYSTSVSTPGRYTLGLTAFVGSSYVAYPSSAGLFILENDGVNIESGIAYANPTAGAAVNGGQGFGFNLTGDNLANGVEVDDIAEFSTVSSGASFSGKIDENFDGNTELGAGFNQALAGNYGQLDATGRGLLSTGTNVVNTLNGGFAVNYYPVDGVTFPFIEMDGGQVAAGVFVQQDASASAAVAAKASAKHLFIARPLIHGRAAKSKPMHK
jgi:hypothetical protein